MTTKTPTLRLGTASPATQDTTAATIRQLAGIAHRAKGLGVDILLLPEAYIGGYPRGSSFGSIVGNRTAEGREEYRQYFRQAIDLGDTVDGGAGAGDKWVRRELGGDGENAAEGVRGDGTREEIERIAKESGVFLVVGCIEKAGGSLYCAVVYVDPKKGMVGKRRKVMPTASERVIWAQGAPATLRAVSTTIKGVRVNLAAAICWESYMPLLRQSLYAQNINLYLAPTADARHTWLGLMQTVAVEGRCFVVSSNMATRKPAKKELSDFRTSEPVTERIVKTGGRRNSCFTEDGFEIALPSPEIPRSVNGDITPSKPKDSKLRRNSCFTQEGFEIALPSESPRPVNGHRHEPAARRNSCLTEEGFEIALPNQDDVRLQKRRKSVIVEDGHEIVLCCDEDGDKMPAKTNGHSATVSLSGSGSGFTSPQRRKQRGAKASEWTCRGGSCIVSPFGDVLAGPQWEDDEGLVWTDVDFEDCIRGRLDLDTAGSYSRNDAFKFSVEGLNLDPLPY